jgi:hypothetical protein
MPTTPAAHASPFQLTVIEAERGSRYRDAVRSADDSVLLVMTDASPGLTAEQIKRCKEVVRRASKERMGPDGVLEALNREFSQASLVASASTARLEPARKVLTVGCAGAPPPWVLRQGSRRPVRMQMDPQVELGRVRGAKFITRTMHFDSGDTLLLPSLAWQPVLAEILARGVTDGVPVADWMSAQAAPPGASLICLTLG